MTVVGLDAASAAASPRAFARDILSIEIEGPIRPQLTLVDIPGLIQTETKGVTKEDKATVAEITDFYIKQERTICLAVVSATNDYANQPILTKVREVDPEGKRTLGIITKPDRLDHGSGSEAAFLSLARNEDIFFKLGWHVVKNRKFEESAFSIEERNASEASLFRSSTFNALTSEALGIDALRTRLSALLFEHVKRELPNLRKDLDIAMRKTASELAKLGTERASAQDCRNYLTTLSLCCLEITKAAVDGHYDGDYFQYFVDDQFSMNSPDSIRRLQAMIQLLNTSFADVMRKNGPKYYIHAQTDGSDSTPLPKSDVGDPIALSRTEALAWIGRVLVRSRGREPVGNYNLLIVDELFWEQSSKWEALAEDHVNCVSQVCKVFLESLLQQKCPQDVHSRLSAMKITDALRSRRKEALGELARLITDNNDFPAIYNRYFTDNLQKARSQRMKTALTNSIDQSTSHTHLPGCHSNHTSASIDIEDAVEDYQNVITHDMEQFSCEDALDNLLSMYKVSLTFSCKKPKLTTQRHRKKFS